MFIETEGTPNPATLKFLPGQAVVGDAGTIDFIDADAVVGRSVLADALFALPGVARVFLGNDFVSVTKSDSADWEELRPLVLSTLMDHFVAGLPVVAEALLFLKTTLPQKMRRLLSRSRNCWIRAYALPLRAMVGTLFFAGIATGLCA